MFTAKKNPGKYEGNSSQLVAQVLDNVIGNGFADEEIGSVDELNHYALIHGKRWSYIVETDNFGFVSYDIGKREEIEKKWEEIVREYDEFYENQKSEN